MKTKFALFIFLLGCNSITNKLPIQEKTSQAIELESKHRSKNLYGINIDDPKDVLTAQAFYNEMKKQKSLDLIEFIPKEIPSVE